MTGAAARATSHRVLKQSGDLLNWRLKSRRSQTPIAELGQCSTMRSVVGNRIHADGADIFRHKGFLVFRPFVVEKCAPGVAEERGELRPGIRRAHIDDADGLDARPRRLGIDQVHKAHRYGWLEPP